MDIILCALLILGILAALLVPSPRRARETASTGPNLFTLTEGDYLNPLFSSPKAVSVLNFAAAGVARFAGFEDFSTCVEVGGSVRIVKVARYHGDLLEVLNVPLLIADPRIPKQDNSIIISESFWDRFLGRNPEILGATLTIHQITYQIAGVASEPAGLLAGTEIWIPVLPRHRKDISSLRILGLLHADADWRSAQRALLQCFNTFMPDQHYIAAAGARLIPIDSAVRFSEPPPVIALKPGLVPMPGAAI